MPLLTLMHHLRCICIFVFAYLYVVDYRLVYICNCIFVLCSVERRLVWSWPCLSCIILSVNALTTNLVKCGYLHFFYHQRHTQAQIKCVLCFYNFLTTYKCSTKSISSKFLKFLMLLKFPNRIFWLEWILCWQEANREANYQEDMLRAWERHNQVRGGAKAFQGWEAEARMGFRVRSMSSKKEGGKSSEAGRKSRGLEEVPKPGFGSEGTLWEADASKPTSKLSCV